MQVDSGHKATMEWTDCPAKKWNTEQPSGQIITTSPAPSLEVKEDDWETQKNWGIFGDDVS